MRSYDIKFFKSTRYFKVICYATYRTFVLERTFDYGWQGVFDIQVSKWSLSHCEGSSRTFSTIWRRYCVFVFHQSQGKWTRWIQQNGYVCTMLSRQRTCTFRCSELPQFLRFQDSWQRSLRVTSEIRRTDNRCVQRYIEGNIEVQRWDNRTGDNVL